MYEAVVTSATSIEGVIYYVIVVRAIGNVEWTMQHRYSHFAELHDKLLDLHEITMSMKYIFDSLNVY